MSIKSYRQYDDPIYQKPVIDVPEKDISSNELLGFLQDMLDTHFQNPKKIGVKIHVFIINKMRNKRGFFTPISFSRMFLNTINWDATNIPPVMKKINAKSATRSCQGYVPKG